MPCPDLYATGFVLLLFASWRPLLLLLLLFFDVSFGGRRASFAATLHRRLWLDENKIVDLSPLALALERNETLQFLSLYKNRIVDVARLAASLALNRSLTMIT